MSNEDYRTRIYEDYTSGFQNEGKEFDIDEAMRWGAAYDYYFRGWLPESKESEILDIACGSGRLLHFFQERGYRNLTGVDISPSQVKLARQVVPNVFEEDAIEFLERKRCSHDLIVGLDIIEHFRKDEVLRFLDECFGSLKQGGRLVLQTPNADSPWGTVHRYNDFTHELCFNPNSIVRLMRLCRFREIETREQGPVPWGYSAKSTIRFLAWRAIRLGLKAWNVAETGSAGSGVFTRIFQVSGRRE